MAEQAPILSRRRRRRNLHAEIGAASGYRPQHNDGPFWAVGMRAVLDGVPPFTLLDVPRMTHDHMIRLCVAMRTSLFLQAMWEVECDDADAKKWIDATVHTCWTRIVPGMLGQYFGWGSSCALPTFNSDGGFLDVTGCRLVTPLGGTPHLWTEGPYNGSFYGIDLDASGLPGGGTGSPSLVRTPFAVWFGGLERKVPLYDESLLSAAYMPWLEKTTRGAALDTRRTYYRRMTVPPVIWRVPRGRVDPSNPRSMTCADYAIQMSESMVNNSTIVVPDDRVMGVDGRGDPQWEAKVFGAVTTPVDILAYVRELDREITRAMGVPPEVLEATESGSGYSGRQIPQQALYSMTDQLVLPMLDAIDRGLLRDLVPHNFGDGVKWRLKAVPLVEAIRKREQQGDIDPLGNLDPTQAAALAAGMTGEQPEDVIAETQPQAKPGRKGTGLVPGVGPKGGTYALNPQTGQKYYDPDHKAAVGLSVGPDAPVGCLLVPVPDPLRAAVLAFGRTIPVEDLAADGLEREPHVTVRHGFAAFSGAGLFERLAPLGSLTLTPGELGVFNTGDRDVLYVAVANDREWRAWRAATDGVECRDTYPDYVPHVTVAYLKPGAGGKYLGGRQLADSPVGCHVVEYVTPDGRKESAPIWPSEGELRAALFGDWVEFGEKVEKEPKKPDAGYGIADNILDVLGKAGIPTSDGPKPALTPRAADEPKPTKRSEGIRENTSDIVKDHGSDSTRQNIYEEIDGYFNPTHPRHQKDAGRHGDDIDAMIGGMEQHDPTATADPRFSHFRGMHQAKKLHGKRQSQSPAASGPKPQPTVTPSGPKPGTAPTPVQQPTTATPPTAGGVGVKPPDPKAGESPPPPPKPLVHPEQPGGAVKTSPSPVSAAKTAMSPPPAPSSAAPKTSPAPVPAAPSPPAGGQAAPKPDASKDTAPPLPPPPGAMPPLPPKPAADIPTLQPVASPSPDGRTVSKARRAGGKSEESDEPLSAGDRIVKSFDDGPLGKVAAWIGRQAGKLGVDTSGGAEPEDEPRQVTVLKRLLDKAFQGPHGDARKPLDRLREQYGVKTTNWDAHVALAKAVGDLLKDGADKADPAGRVVDLADGTRLRVKVSPGANGKSKLQLYLVGGGGAADAATPSAKPIAPNKPTPAVPDEPDEPDLTGLEDPATPAAPPATIPAAHTLAEADDGSEADADRTSSVLASPSVGANTPTRTLPGGDETPEPEATSDNGVVSGTKGQPFVTQFAPVVPPAVPAAGEDPVVPTTAADVVEPETSATGDADTDHAAVASEKVLKSIRDNTNLSDEQKRRYEGAAKRVLSNLSPAAQKHVATGLKSARFFPSGSDLLRGVLSAPDVTMSADDREFLEQRLHLDQNGTPFRGGAYSFGDRHMFLDGGGFTRSGRYAYGDENSGGEDHTYAHEMGHFLDEASGDDGQWVSKSPSWLAAFAEEIKPDVGGVPAITSYAKNNPTEGFAEAARIVLSGVYDLVEFERAFPKVTAVFRKIGLWPSFGGELPLSARTEVFDPAGRIELGGESHLDPLLNQPTTVVPTGGDQPPATGDEPPPPPVGKRRTLAEMKAAAGSKKAGGAATAPVEPVASAVPASIGESAPPAADDATGSGPVPEGGQNPPPQPASSAPVVAPARPPVSSLLPARPAGVGDGLWKQLLEVARAIDSNPAKMPLVVKSDPKRRAEALLRELKAQKVYQDIFGKPPEIESDGQKAQAEASRAWVESAPQRREAGPLPSLRVGPYGETKWSESDMDWVAVLNAGGKKRLDEMIAADAGSSGDRPARLYGLGRTMAGRKMVDAAIDMKRLTREDVATAVDEGLAAALVRFDPSHVLPDGRTVLEKAGGDEWKAIKNVAGDLVRRSVENLLGRRKAVRYIGDSVNADGEATDSPIDTATSREVGPGSAAIRADERAEMKAAIDEALTPFRAKDREVVYRKFGLGDHAEQDDGDIATAMGLTDRQVKAAVKRFEDAIVEKYPHVRERLRGLHREAGRVDGDRQTHFSVPPDGVEILDIEIDTADFTG